LEPAENRDELPLSRIQFAGHRMDLITERNPRQIMPRTIEADAPASRDADGMKPGRKTLIIVVGTGLAAFIAFILLLVELPRQEQLAARWVDHTLEVLNVATSLDLHLAAVTSEARGFMIDKRADSNARFGAATLLVFSDIVNLRTLTADNSVQQSRLGLIEPIINARIGMLRDIIERLGSGDDLNGARIVTMRLTSLALTEQISTLAADFKAEEWHLLAERRSTARRGMGLWLGFSLGSGILAAASGFFAAVLVMGRTREREHMAELRQLNAGLEDRVLARNTEIARQVEALERSNRELNDFAYIASHDLKEPLRGLFNNATFLREDYAEKLDQEGVSRLFRVGYLCQRMEQLINSLLYFSRLGHQELTVQRTDLGAVIRDIEMMSETTLNECNVTIVIPRELPFVRCDKTRITEVFRSLIINAVKYNENEKKTVEIGCRDEVTRGNFVERQVFYVKDDGIGIAEEFHEDIFRIFKRLNAEADNEKGVGVGLTFARKIVERHGGRIWLDSALGLGSTFYFTIVPSLTLT
jgi:signal transduction histidine kinase